MDGVRVGGDSSNAVATRDFQKSGIFSWKIGLIHYRSATRDVTNLSSRVMAHSD